MIDRKALQISLRLAPGPGAACSNWIRIQVQFPPLALAGAAGSPSGLLPRAVTHRAAPYGYSPSGQLLRARVSGLMTANGGVGLQQDPDPPPTWVTP